METKDKYKFDEKKHLHTLNGKALTGVTTVLGVISKGDGLIQWSANEAVKHLQEHPGEFEKAKTAWKNSRDKAGKSGTDIHAIVEDIIKTALLTGGWIVNLKTHSEPQIQNFLNWALGNSVRFLDSERNVWSKELWIGGIVDFVCEINGEVFVGDIKTAKSIYATNYWQTSAYQFCLQEMGLYPKVKGFKVVRLGKDGTFEVGENYSYENNIEGFKSALIIYRMLNLIS